TGTRQAAGQRMSAGGEERAWREFSNSERGGKAISPESLRGPTTLHDSWLFPPQVPLGELGSLLERGPPPSERDRAPPFRRKPAGPPPVGSDHAKSRTGRRPPHW